MKSKMTLAKRTICLFKYKQNDVILLCFIMITYIDLFKFLVKLLLGKLADLSLSLMPHQNHCISLVVTFPVCCR